MADALVVAFTNWQDERMEPVGTIEFEKIINKDE